MAAVSGLPPELPKNNLEEDDKESYSSRSSSLSFSLEAVPEPEFIQEGHWCTAPSAALSCDSLRSYVEQEHSGTGWERKDNDFDFADHPDSLLIRLFLMSRRIDFTHVTFAWYRCSRVCSKSSATSFLLLAGASQSTQILYKNSSFLYSCMKNVFQKTKTSSTLSSKTVFSMVKLNIYWLAFSPFPTLCLVDAITLAITCLVGMFLM